jgi:hypothetical protein
VTLNSETAAQRQAAYDAAVKKLHDINPKLAPVAKIEDAFSIPRVAQQAREAVAPEPLPPSSEIRLLSRASAMQNSCADLVGRAKRLGIKTELPKVSDADPLATLQLLNKFHDDLEKQIEYFQTYSQEQRAIDTLWKQAARDAKRLDAIEKRLAAMSAALGSISELLPHLLPAPGKKEKA